MSLFSLFIEGALPLCSILIFTAQCAAQETKGLASQAPFQAIEINDGTLDGPGAETFLDQCRSSHFILFGEAHGVGGIAEFVSATHRSLPSDPFYHLVIEAGDWFSSQLANGDFADTLDRNPYSLAFDYNGDLSLIEQVKSAGKGREKTVIGVDQEACAIHPFDYLAKEADTYSARQLSKCLTLKALFLSGRYIRSDYQLDLETLRGRMPANSVALNVVDSVAESIEIFVDHVNGRVQQSVEKRESRMMEVFDSAIQDLSLHHPNSRLIFKMGGAHTIRGMGPNGVVTLGEHVARKADENGQKSLHVSIYPWKEGDTILLPEELRDHPYVLVNCEELQKSLATELNSGSFQDAQKAIGQSDWIVLLPRPGQASKSRIQQKQQSFVRSKLVHVSLVLIPILLLLPLYWKSLASCWRWIGGNRSDDKLLGRMPLWISLVMLFLIVFQIGLLAFSPDRATPTSFWLFITLEIFSAVSVATVVVCVFGVSISKSIKISDKTIYFGGCAGCLGLAYFSHAWGLGNLLGI